MTRRMATPGAAASPPEVENARKILELERRQGHQDRAVTTGLAVVPGQLGAPRAPRPAARSSRRWREQVLAALDGYAELAPPARAERIGGGPGAARMAGAGDGPGSASPPTPPRVRRRGETDCRFPLAAMQRGAGGGATRTGEGSLPDLGDHRRRAHPARSLAQHPSTQHPAPASGHAARSGQGHQGERGAAVRQLGPPRLRRPAPPLPDPLPGVSAADRRRRPADAADRQLRRDRPAGRHRAEPARRPPQDRRHHRGPDRPGQRHLVPSRAVQPGPGRASAWRSAAS